MISRRGPTESIHSEGWVLVTHEENRDERNPQYNEDNESSAQLASAVDGNPEPHEVEHADIEEEGRSALCRKTESNVSTETASSNTMTGLINTVGALGNTVVGIHPAGGVLTESSLHRLQRELSQGFSSNICQWVEGTTGFCLSATANEVESTMQNSMVMYSGRSKASTVSSMSLDREPPPPEVSRTHDFSGMGGWC